jgi:REJ domain/Putative Ig domain
MEVAPQKTNRKKMSKQMKKHIISISSWRLAAITIGSVLAITVASTALTAPAPNVTSGNAAGTLGVAFSYQITANQSIPNGGWGATGLPPGLTGPSATGLISGTPTTAGSYTVHLSATNANGTGTRNVTFTISTPPPPTVTSSGTASGTWGQLFSYQITATNNPTSYGTTVSIPGVNFDASTGSFSGTPTQLGQFSGTISATNAYGTGGKTLTVTINPQTHTAPTSIAAISPAAVWEGDTVTLDGTQSHTNPDDGSPLIYQWQQQAPNSPALSLSPNNKTVVATFVAPAPQPLGTLSWPVTFQLKVTDNLVSGGDKNTESDPVSTTVYAKPVADAEPKGAHVYEGTLVRLHAYATTVAPGATLSYTWTAPNGITLSDIHAQNPTFTAPAVGPAGTTLTFTLKVTEHVDGLSHDQDSAADSVTINVDHVNQPPTAYASTQPIVDPNNLVSMAEVPENTDPVTLYGAGSDPENAPLTFHWTQVHDTEGHALQAGDTAVELSDDTSATPTFTAPDVSTAQQHIDLIFQLITNDGQLNSGPSYVTIRVNNTNDPPVADPTVSPLSALEGDLVTLDGSLSSDPNNDPLTYTWAQAPHPPTVPTVSLAGANTASASFVAPTVTAAQQSITLTFNLTVFDGELSDTKPVSVTVSHRNLPPVADAGQTQSVPERSTASLDGENSYDPEGDALTFSWVQVHDATGTALQPGDPAVGLIPQDPDNKEVSFEAPTFGVGGGTLYFKLSVTDSHGASGSAIVEVDVTYANRPPILDLPNDQTVNEGATVNVAGSATDPDNNPLTFIWSQYSGPTVTIVPDSPGSPNATFIAPEVACGGDVVVMTLTVDDGYGGTDSKDININIANFNHPLTAIGGGNQQVNEEEVVSLNGSGSDADTEEGVSLAFEWTQISGSPTVTLNGSGKDVSFTAPDIPGGDPDASLDLGFRLTVTAICGDSVVMSATDDVTVNVKNIAHAPIAVATSNPASANEGGSTVQLDGSGSSDPDFDPLTYTWTQCSGPHVDLVYSPGDTAHVMPSFITPWVSADTPVKFKLTVTDPYGLNSSAYVTVNIVNWHTPPSVANARADVPVLWPPDHKMLPVQILGVIKPSDDKVTITGVTQDEPTNGLGDGDTPVDASVHNYADKDDTVDLRAERSGNRDGRVYRVSFTVTDPEQSASGMVKVMVPKSKKTDAAIDSGGNYDSTH